MKFQLLFSLSIYFQNSLAFNSHNLLKIRNSYRFELYDLGSLNNIPQDIKFFARNTIQNSLITGIIVGVLPSLCFAQLKDDEIEVEFISDYLGLGLVEITYKKARRVVIQSVKTDSESVSLPQIKAGMIVVSVGGKSVEGMSLVQVAEIIRNQPRPFKAVLRDPGRFFDQLDSSRSAAAIISTQVRPSTSVEYAGETLRVSRIQRPEVCTQPASVGDVLEITYQARLSDGTVVDGVKNMEDTNAFTTNVYFVLGGQSSGSSFPPGMDMSLRGMCVGERRLITLPPSLAYGSTGLKLKGIPKDATVLYDVRLVSRNGIAEMK
mmetsp:Transcript_15716/g.15853  ORF Transcript_15716/g.15853 Transcript_15716/m.15853 type:complete len:321 (-) Transcript_15716:70-1032(-)|eukprot:CAMPEP_0182428658 /NCGR_PEP_ID=MMETSP1167-20130531/23185_1 /TAXON_ID=2988 /ORGANISM="Mallomonas Sp, Strain CCMP3275" /LENGTH=320 /DNA_ID=CAMNT_0024611669 /DNA_START=91 /DNA_END=1053 /DNA_ORIENTATION=+